MENLSCSTMWLKTQEFHLINIKLQFLFRLVPFQIADRRHPLPQIWFIDLWTVTTKCCIRYLNITVLSTQMQSKSGMYCGPQKIAKISLLKDLMKIRKLTYSLKCPKSQERIAYAKMCPECKENLEGMTSILSPQLSFCLSNFLNFKIFSLNSEIVIPKRIFGFWNQLIQVLGKEFQL